MKKLKVLVIIVSLALTCVTIAFMRTAGMYGLENLGWGSAEFRRLTRAVVAYVSLLVHARLTGVRLEWPQHHVLFVAALGVLGFVVSFQVRRVRLLSEYHDLRCLK